MARRLAVAVSQAPGLSGTPPLGQCSSAVTRASWASSSARPTSRTSRASPAISRGDSILQIAWIVRCVSEAVTASDQSIFPPLLPTFLQLLTASADAILLRAQLGGHRITEIRRLDYLPDLDLGGLRRGTDWGSA